MGVDCTVRFANGLGSESHLNITVYYKTDDTEDEIQVKRIHIDGSDYESLTFNYLEKVYCKTAGGYAYVDLDTNAFDGQESTAYFTTNEYWSSDGLVYNLAGVSCGISDEDTGHPHGKNLWLIRWDANTVDDDDDFPADGTSYMKGLFLPFEQALVESGVPLRGFVNYADTELSKEEQASRLYGRNYDRLKKIKSEVDPEGLFTNNPQSIPLPETPGSLRVQGQGA